MNETRLESSRGERPRYILFHKDHPFSPLGVHSGAEMGTIHLARSLVASGADVTVVARLVTGSDTVDGVRYRDLGDRYDLGRGLAILRELEAPETCLISVTRADVLYRSLELSGIERRVLWLQDSDLRETCASVRQIDEACDRIVYVAEALRRHLEDEGLPSTIGEVIPNGFDPEIFFPTEEPFHPRRIVYAGALVPEKGVDLLIEAFRLLKERLTDAELWLYGSSALWGRRASFEPERLRALVPDLHFPGPVGQREIARAFRSAALAVIPSRRSARLEPFPLSSVEAQASGCPVVVANNGGLAEGVVPGETGLVVGDEDASELAEAIHAALADGGRLRKMRRAAAKHARSRYAWAGIADRFTKLLPRARNRRARAPVEKDKARVAVFYVRLPQYDRYGGDFRAFRLLRALVGGGHPVTLVARDALLDPEDTAKYRLRYEDMGIEVRILNRVVRRGGHWTQLPVLTLEEVVAGRRFDAAWILWWNLGLELVPRLRRLLPETRLVVDSVDVAYLRLLRQASLSSSSEDWRLASHTKRHELDAYRMADHVITVTEDDRATLLRDLPASKVSVVPNVHGLAESPRTYGERRGLLFVGFYEHLPNTDAALYFAAEIFPRVRARLPDATLYLVGNAPPPAVRELESDDVVVTGYVEDLTPFWQGARVSIAPLRYGAGMKGKIGQAMAEGLPVVTTSVGAEGMDLVHERHALVADDPESFADAVVRLYTDESLWCAISEAGRRLVRERWSDDVVVARLLEALLDTGTPRDRAPAAAAREAAELELVAEGHEWLALRSFAAARLLFETAVARHPELACALSALSALEEEEGNDSRGPPPAKPRGAAGSLERLLASPAGAAPRETRILPGSGVSP